MEPFDPLHDIHQYSPTLTIAQVLTFCARKGLPVTRAMVQNYIRDGLLPPPAGRIYTHKHLAALALIGRLKAAFDMPAIKKALAPLMDGEGLPLDKYTRIMQTLATAQTQWEAHVAPIFHNNGDTRESDTSIPSKMAFVAALRAQPN